jgi:hypothetical protein
VKRDLEEGEQVGGSLGGRHEMHFEREDPERGKAVVPAAAWLSLWAIETS